MAKVSREGVLFVSRLSQLRQSHPTHQVTGIPRFSLFSLNSFYLRLLS